MQAAGDLRGQTALLRLPGECGAGSVDEGDQRQAQLFGQVHASPRLAQRRRTEGRGQALSPPVLPEDDARRAAEPGQGQQEPGILLARSG
ncbi:MAG: hypothetical protein JWP33_851, partial [Blastococcus sp.]|nr:hypothetical protein [Blastococcus sp.]